MRTAIALSACLLTVVAAMADANMDELERQFRELPMAARRLTGPLFWLHGTESPERLEAILQKVAEGGNGMFVAESRPHNDWLGEGWYRDLAVCVEAAKQHNLQMIIFDDYWWPSQMMGGRVPPEYGCKVLQASSSAVAGPARLAAGGYGDTNLIAVIAGRQAAGDAVDGGSLVNLTTSIKDGVLHWDAPAGDWRVMKFTWAFKGKVGAQQRMISVDGADPECVDWFIRTVYQPHYDRFKADFGKTIVGFFYDEPETQGDWGRDMLALAAERKTDLDRLLVAYKFKLAGDEQTAAYYAYLDLFAESWGRTMYGGMAKWCRDHGVFSMGHFMEHDGCFHSRGMSGGNVMQLQKYSDMGGIDLVCRQLYPGQRKMGLYQMPKIASSISHTYNKADDIAFCEIYGAYGQDITYPQMKWLADWHHVRGVSLLNPHSFNPRAPYDRDCPPYFYNGGCEPRWPLYRVWADYSCRLSVMLTGGRHVCPVAFLNVGQSVHVGKTVRPEEFTSTLQDALLDCDWLLYDAWEDAARLEGRTIKLHKEDYSILVVPPVEVIPYATLAKAKQFFEQGGIVVGYDVLPAKSATPGRTSVEIAALREAIWGAASPGPAACKTSAAGGRSYFLPAKPAVADVRRALVEDAGIRPTLDVLEGDTGDWLHVLHRVKSGSDVFLVCNQNHTGPARRFKLRAAASGHPECWDAMRNAVTSIPFQRLGDRQVEFSLTLEPSESVLIVFRQDQRELPRRQEAPVQQAPGAIPVVRMATPAELVVPNSPPADSPGSGELTLDGCAWVWYPDTNPLAAAPPGRRYFRGVCTIPAGRQVKRARWVGTCDNAFVLYVNGQEIARSSDESEGWRKVTRGDLTPALVAGRNVLAISALNLTDAPSPAGLIGRYEIAFEDGDPLTGRVDGGWKSSDKAPPQWNESGFDDSAWVAAKELGAYGCQPWGRLTKSALTASPVTSDPFAGHCAVPADWNLATERVFLEMDAPSPEDAVRVTVNGRYAGGFIGKPYRLDVAACLKPGDNRIVIEPFAPKTVWLTRGER